MPIAGCPDRVIRVGAAMSAFGGIAEMNSCGKVAMGPL